MSRLVEECARVRLFELSIGVRKLDLEGFVVRICCTQGSHMIEFILRDQSAC
jgi:hypothetical protein